MPMVVSMHESMARVRAADALMRSSGMAASNPRRVGHGCREQERARLVVHQPNGASGQPAIRLNGVMRLNAE